MKTVEKLKLRAIGAVLFPIVLTSVYLWKILFESGVDLYIEGLTGNSVFLVTQLCGYVAIALWVVTISRVAFETLSAPEIRFEHGTAYLVDEDGKTLKPVEKVKSRRFFMFNRLFEIQGENRSLVLCDLYLTTPSSKALMRIASS